jgi:hypothetical protein
MTDQTEIPINFVNFYQLGMGRAEELLQIQQFEDWNGDFSFLDGDATSLRGKMEFLGLLDEFRLALEYFISVGDDDLPQDIWHGGLVLGDLVGSAELTGLSDDALHALAIHNRRVMFPDLPDMTEADKQAARARVRLTNRDVRDWMYHLLFPNDPPLTEAQCRDPQTMMISSWFHHLRKQKEAGGPHWPHVPIVFAPFPRAK